LVPARAEVPSSGPARRGRLAGLRWGVVLFALGLATLLTLVLSGLPQGQPPLLAPGAPPVAPTGLFDRAAAALMSVMAASALGLYACLFLPRGFATFRRMLLLALVVLSWATVAKLFLGVTLPDHGHRYLAFMLPMAAAPMLIAALLDIGLGLVATVVLGLLTAVLGFARLDPGLSLQLPRDVLQMVTVFLLGGVTGVFVVKRAERANRYLTAGASVALVTFLSLLAFWLQSSDRRIVDLLWMFSASSLGGVLSALVGMGGASIVGPLFGITTRMQLMALAQLNHPLLRRLQQEAPGTFHHSAIVGNLAERAADLIDADGLLVRAGCYFHDIGKLVKPSYYIENQANGESPYENLTPQASAGMVIEHVSAGMELARRHRVPESVRAFIPEHHGTRLVTYFFRKAFSEDPGVDPAPFRYLGPKPQTRETAIVMLADSVEAVVRSSHDRSPGGSRPWCRR
jgi:putative nucleotidyltransferase with HDIG domain